ncbi:MAG: hypothetical protein CMG34_03595 [Candidatus Marinimicrobia bacterium]|nr:hypothetical protein [Candidatus Neomarinimicrobiota bacterium]
MADHSASATGFGWWPVQCHQTLKYPRGGTAMNKFTKAMDQFLTEGLARIDEIPDEVLARLLDDDRPEPTFNQPHGMV